MPAKKQELPGVELFRYFSPSRRFLVSVRDNGESWAKTSGSKWFLSFRKKDDAPYERWLAGKREKYESLPAWAKNVRSIPSAATLDKWSNDGVCRTVTGDMVEPDGEGPDGAPSWLVALGLI